MILHVDMDAFYASVEQRDHPELRRKPVIVGGTAEGRGVVCAASYEARQFGVHSAMPAATAVRLCPQAIFIPPRMAHYAEISSQIREIFSRYTPLVEPLSLDEAFLDVTGSERLFGDAKTIGKRIKTDISNELSLVASVGAAPNKFLAKVASDLEKPDGFVVVNRNEEQSFLEPLAVGRLWGVGKVMQQKLDRLGIKTIADLRRLDLRAMQDLFGEQGEHLWQLSRGIDERRVVPDREAKSISHESTFSKDITDQSVIRAWLLELAEQVGRRLRRHQLSGRTVHLKVRYHDFRTVVRSHSLREPTCQTREIFEHAWNLFHNKIGKAPPPVRLLGVGVSRFSAADVRQASLFDEEERQQQNRLDATTDSIRDRFGQDALSRGSRLLHGAKHRPQPRPET